MGASIVNLILNFSVSIFFQRKKKKLFGFSEATFYKWLIMGVIAMFTSMFQKAQIKVHRSKGRTLLCSCLCLALKK